MNLKTKLRNQKAGTDNKDRVLSAAFERAMKRKADLFATVLSFEANQENFNHPIGKPLVHTAVMKPVASLCNLHCHYCYARNNADFQEQTEDRSPRMKKEVLERAISQILQVSAPTVRFIWHGGEPLLAGHDFFEEVLSLQLKYGKKKAKIINAIQTNATLIDDEWASFFKEKDFEVGVSLDGTKNGHNVHRVYPSGKGSFQKALSGIKRLQDAGLSPGALLVLTPKNIQKPSNVLHTFIVNNIPRFEVLPCHSEGDLLLPPSTYAEFMIGLFDAWLASGNEEISIRFFEDVMDVLIGNIPSVCWASGHCMNVINIERNGDVLACDSPFDPNVARFGSIIESDLLDILDSKRCQDFLCKDKDRQDSCSSCQWFLFCRGGCPFWRTIHGNNIDGEFYFCSSYKQIMSHIIQYIGELNKN
jgi:uncharacterized protein